MFIAFMFAWLGAMVIVLAIYIFIVKGDDNDIFPRREPVLRVDMDRRDDVRHHMGRPGNGRD